MQKRNLFLTVLFCTSQLVAQLVVDPLPYASIANPLPDTMDQLKRDSFNLKFSPIRINQAGYRPQDDKYFYYVAASGTPSSFKVIDYSSGATVGTGTLTSTAYKCNSQLHIKASNNAQIVGGGDTRYILDSKVHDGTMYSGILPDLNPGTYRVVVGSDTSAKFVVNEQLYGWVRDALLKFYGVNRCGNGNSWFHKDCHVQDAAIGGWHDCGDHLKEGLTMGHTAAVLGLCAAVFQDRDHDVYAANQGVTRVTDGVPDILYEAKHGADFILNSYDKAGGQVSKMVTSVGDFGNDHNWWGRPENQEKMPTVRGGPVRAARVEVGGNIIGNYAANLALVSKVIRTYNAPYADRCLKAAKEIYAYAKANPAQASSSPAYSGNNKTYDKLALAAVALIYATGDKSYLNDLCYDKTIGTKYNAAFPKFSYEGGWFAMDNPDFDHYTANTDWASVQMYASWGFFRLVLMNEELCKSLGLSESQRNVLIEKTAYSVLMNLGRIGNNGDLLVSLPQTGGWVPSDVRVESPWMVMHTQMEWVWNRYQAGNITDMFCYYDVASKIQGMELPNTPASTDWKANDIKKIMIRQLDYMLGVNPWDISMIYGVGNKNFNHPHHRAANPEGKNVPGAFYKYIPPVGALQGGFKPTTTTNLYNEFWGTYQNSETGIDGTSAILVPVVGLAKEEPITNPFGKVKIVYVGSDRATIEVTQSRYGKTELYYGTDGLTSQTKTSDSAGITHTFELTGLKSGTVYSFYVKVSDLFGRDSIIKNVDIDKNVINFEFKTLTSSLTNAEIRKVKICRVTYDSAEIFWYTPNGEFDSKVVYGETKPPTTVNNIDASGHPTKFHYVKIGGLKEKTTYYFYVQSGTSIDDNGGAFYQFTTPVEHVNFDVRAVRYTWEGMPSMGIGVINQDVKSYDSLDLRLYFRAKEGFENDLAARLDIIIRYREDGFQDSVTGALKAQIWDNLKNQHPTKMDDTYNPVDDTYAYYFSIPLWGLEMRSQSRLRLDVVFDTWEPLRLKDHLNQAPKHVITNEDWSFGPHSVAKGDPIDFPGIPVVTNKDDIDNNYWNLPIDNYICVYRKGEFVWGYSPSKAEMQTKKTYFTVESHITSPVNNPTQQDTVITQVAKSINITGWAKVTPVDGKINDIWVNGVPVSNLSSVISWNASAQRYDYVLPATLKGEFNEFDVTIFAGPDEDCTECYGCANYNHHFNLKYVGAKQYPSMIALKDASWNVLTSDTAKLDTTKFNIEVKDQNGNLRGKAKDSIYVSVSNPVLGDSTRVLLVETGDSTGVFQSISMISVVNKTAAQTGSAEIGMSGGDKVWVTYIDPTDPSDISEATLVSKADFPVASSGALYDRNGDGTIDKMVINYNIPLKMTPDSVVFPFPASTDMHTVKSTVDNFKIANNQLTIELFNELTKGVTAFTSGKNQTAKSYLQSSGATKVSAFMLGDSAGPVIATSVTLFEKNGAGDDTIAVTFSEVVNLPVNDGTVLKLWQNGTGNNLTVIGIIEQVQNTYKMLVRSNAAIKDGDSLTINSAGNVTDAFGNHAHLSNPKMPIILKEAVPRIVSAFYTADKNGMLDKVEITFAKKITYDDISFGFKWNEGTRVAIPSGNVTAIGTDGSKVQVKIKELLTGTKVVTSGKMDLLAFHKNFPKDTIKSNVADNAAPVILSAELNPSSKKENGLYVDTLTVIFSEAVENITADQPFTFKSMPTGASYTMKMANSYQNGSDATKQVFYVSSYIGVEFPNSNDSIRIDVTRKVSDKNGNVQVILENRFAPMKANPIPFDVIVKKGPNPFTPVSAVTTPSSYTDAVAAAKDKKGTLFVFTPDTTRIKREVNLDGTKVKIFDLFGNVVRDELCKSDEQKTKVYFFWDGRNKSGRMVGAGTYKVIVYVVNEGVPVKTSREPFNISVKR